MDAMRAAHLGRAIGLMELAVDLATLQHGAPPAIAQALWAHASSALAQSRVHEAIEEARLAWPGAPPTPRAATELWSFASAARAWASSNLAPTSIVARSLRVGIAAGGTLRAAHLLLGAPESVWRSSLRLDPWETARTALGDARTNLGWVAAAGALPEPLASLAGRIRAAAEALAPAVETPGAREIAGRVLVDLGGALADPRLWSALGALPADGGPYATMAAVPAQQSMSAPMAPFPALPSPATRVVPGQDHPIAGGSPHRAPAEVSSHEGARDWKQACHDRRASLQGVTDPAARFQMLVEIGDIWAKQEGEQDKAEARRKALEAYEEALSIEPRNHITRNDWKQLEGAYRTMLRRLVGTPAERTPDLEPNLWHGLGVIWRDRLGDPHNAIEAFRMASRLRPEDAEGHMILAELHETTGQLDAAIQAFQTLVKLDPMRVEPYRRLYGLFLKKKDYDPAWCLAGLLSFLGRASEDEKRFYADHKPAGMLQARARLDDDGWIRRLFRDDQHLLVGKVFEMIAAAALRAKIDTLKQKGQLPTLDPRFLQDPTSSTVTFARTFGWAADVLGLPTPPLYLRSDVPGALTHVPADPPSSLAGQTMMSVTPPQLTFMVGKHLSHYRGEHLIKTLFPTVVELTVLFLAAIKLAAAGAPPPKALEKQVIMTAQLLGQYMSPAHVEGLRGAVNRFMAESGVANLKQWSQSVEITASRAGLLVCGDLEVAKSVIAREPQQPGDLSPAEKMKELILFAASDGYFQLRRQLGFQIQV